MRIAINTGGGDAPGLNAVIRAVVLSALNLGWDVYGIRNGYQGLFEDDGVVALTRESVRGITHQGGTILGTTNRGNPLEWPVERPDGSLELVDRSDEIIGEFRRRGMDALIAIGGDGSLRIASVLADKGLPVVGVPKTIDNDLASTQVTFGFNTAVATATDAIGRLHSTAEAHGRVMVVELMGRNAGWIALFAGVAATADVILIPEIPYSLDTLCAKIEERYEAGHGFAIVVAAEGAADAGGSQTFKEQTHGGASPRLGGIGERLAAQIEERTGHETRSLALGHPPAGRGAQRLRPTAGHSLRIGRRGAGEGPALRLYGGSRPAKRSCRPAERGHREGEARARGWRRGADGAERGDLVRRRAVSVLSQKYGVEPRGPKRRPGKAR